MTNNCHDCQVRPGQLHKAGCDVERCPRCGLQMISCGCVYIVCGINLDTMEAYYPEIYYGGPTQNMLQMWERAWGYLRLPWTGSWPGQEECEKYGFWCVGPPWRTVPAGTPDAVHDLNRLVEECRWCPIKRKWLKRV